jgi:hypothetical protein
MRRVNNPNAPYWLEDPAPLLGDTENFLKRRTRYSFGDTRKKFGEKKSFRMKKTLLKVR